MLEYFDLQLDNKRVILQPKGPVGRSHLKELEDQLLFLLQSCDEVVLDVTDNDQETLLESLLLEFEEADTDDEADSGSLSRLLVHNN